MYGTVLAVRRGGVSLSLSLYEILRYLFPEMLEEFPFAFLLFRISNKRDIYEE